MVKVFKKTVDIYEYHSVDNKVFKKKSECLMYEMNRYAAKVYLVMFEGSSPLIFETMELAATYLKDDIKHNHRGVRVVEKPIINMSYLKSKKEIEEVIEKEKK